MRDFSPHLSAIRARLDGYGERGLKVFATTSCQSNSVLLLHVLSQLAPQIPVYFLNTGYHFPETLEFRRRLARSLGLNIIDLLSSLPRLHQQTEGRFLFATDPDYCCQVNKIEPLEPVIRSHDVWISGIRAEQSAARGAMREEQAGRHGVLRYHPLLSWDGAMVADYVAQHDLPRHPLEEAGYPSVGCRPCTRRPAAAEGEERAGRWFGLKKTECGLHTTLAKE